MQPYRNPRLRSRVQAVNTQMGSSTRPLASSSTACQISIPRFHHPPTMSDPEDRNTVTRFMIEKALWNCCVSLSLTEILPNLYIGG